ncbi:uncharacterized histidine-rich protein DDB_G0274557-like [Macrosteles quadrilineatus]|uniref:uncharacterized histidine-rich protein DDB_G0274557-like n=1 Tax=Macrosteles quadrilineatus TaxID=74068 RepID=UPI0023E15E7D|nr:uncharacterized histidine-rich protein DDB_G0274557-like [Macrosteles quadrilineatus]
MDLAKLGILLIAMVGLIFSAPAPDGHHHKKFIIHVPYKIHTIHHHHIKKIPIFHHYEHYDHHHHHHHHHHEEVHHDYHEDYHDDHY